MSRFSFIIPVYNCAIYLERCINDILKIGVSDYEIILINDGSTDSSEQICQELSAKYERVKCFTQANKGVSVARNYGISEADGDYIIFFDADDNIEPDKMKIVLNEVENYSDVDLAIFGVSFDYYYHHNCYRRDILCYPYQGCLLREKWTLDFDVLYSVNALSPIWNKVFRRDILEKHGLQFNTDMFLYEDLEFSIRYMAHCNTIFNMPGCVYHYRQSEDEGNAGRRLNRIEKLTDVVDLIEAALDEFIGTQEMDDQSQKIKAILLELYIVIAREKIAVSNKDEIGQICDEFRHWMESRNLVISTDQQNFVDLLIKRKIRQIMMHRTYVSVRHRIAVRVKALMRKYKK